MPSRGNLKSVLCPSPCPRAGMRLSLPARSSGALAHGFASAKSSGLYLSFGRGMAGGFSQAVQIVRPCLHHAATLRQVLGKVVTRPDAVTLPVGKLALYPVPVVGLFVEQGGGDGTEAVEVI